MPNVLQHHNKTLFNAARNFLQLCNEVSQKKKEKKRLTLVNVGGFCSTKFAVCAGYKNIFIYVNALASIFPLSALTWRLSY